MEKCLHTYCHLKIENLVRASDLWPHLGMQCSTITTKYNKWSVTLHGTSPADSKPSNESTGSASTSNSCVSLLHFYLNSYLWNTKSVTICLPNRRWITPMGILHQPVGNVSFFKQINTSNEDRRVVSLLAFHSNSPCHQLTLMQQFVIWLHTRTEAQRSGQL